MHRTEFYLKADQLYDYNRSVSCHGLWEIYWGHDVSAMNIDAFCGTKPSYISEDTEVVSAFLIQFICNWLKQKYFQY
jgi:hypothetical protein